MSSVRAQKEYKKGHYKIALRVHRELCKKKLIKKSKQTHRQPV